MSIVKLVQPIDAATGRNRKVALKAILKRMENLSVHAVDYDVSGSTMAKVQMSDLSLTWHPMPDSECFGIHRDGVLVMSGHLYADGSTHVMSWKRGFEAALFEDIGKVIS